MAPGFGYISTRRTFASSKILPFFQSAISATIFDRSPDPMIPLESALKLVPETIERMSIFRLSPKNPTPKSPYNPLTTPCAPFRSTPYGNAGRDAANLAEPT